jgi:hypothetical protein
VYVHQPPGFVLQGHEHKILKLYKALSTLLLSSHLSLRLKMEGQPKPSEPSSTSPVSQYMLTSSLSSRECFILTRTKTLFIKSGTTLIMFWISKLALPAYIRLGLGSLNWKHPFIETFCSWVMCMTSREFWLLELISKWGWSK